MPSSLGALIKSLDLEGDVEDGLRKLGATSLSKLEAGSHKGIITRSVLEREGLSPIAAHLLMESMEMHSAVGFSYTFGQA